MFPDYPSDRDTACSRCALLEGESAGRTIKTRPAGGDAPCPRMISAHSPTGRQPAGKPGREETTVITTLRLPLTELITTDPMASVDTTLWQCRLCDHEGRTTTQPRAHAKAIAHLTGVHHAVSESDQRT